PRMVCTCLTSTSALGAGATLSVFLGLPQDAVAFGSLAIVSLLLLTRQIVSLSQQASSSRYEQEQLASLQLVRSWENELTENQQKLAKTHQSITERFEKPMGTLSSMTVHSGKNEHSH